MFYLICIAVAVLLLFYVLWSILRRKFYVDGLTCKHVFITGCDTGFGRALAKRLDTLGVPVFAGCLTEEGAQNLRQETSERLQTILVDVSSHNSIVKAYGIIKTRLEADKGLWGLVNNAGIFGAGGPPEFSTRPDYEKLFAVNLFGMIDVTNTFLPLLKKSKGRIVNTSSVAVIVASPETPSYTCSKFAVYGWSELLRRNMKLWGVGVATILPGFFKTPIVDTERVISLRKRQWDALPEDVKDEYGDEYRDQRLRKETFDNRVKAMANPNLDPVVNAYEHGLFSRYPKARYLCGTDAKLVYFIHCLPLSDIIMDFIISRVNLNAVIPKVLRDEPRP